VGLDVHARSVAATASDGVTGELFRPKLTPSPEHICWWVQNLPGPVAVTCEAGPTGFDLYRWLTAAGIRAKLPHLRSCRSRRENGSRPRPRDAVHLAKLLRPEQVTAVANPSPDQEAAPDMGRVREDCRADLMRAPAPAHQAAAAPRHRLLRRHRLDRQARRLTAPLDTTSAEHPGDPVDLRLRLRKRPGQ
jgi:transposase